MGVSPYTGEAVLGAGHCLHVAGQSCGEEPVPISAQEVCVRHPTSGRRLALLCAVESNAGLREIMRYFPRMEIEAKLRIKGIDGVDIIGLSSSGIPTCLLACSSPTFDPSPTFEMYKQWGQVVVAHRCDSGAGEEFGSRQANSGSHISACMLGHIGPVTSKYGIHTYRALDGPDFDDQHVDQLPLITGYELFAESFADELADQLRISTQLQPAEVALQQPEVHPPVDCGLRHVLIELMLSPTQPLKQDDTAGNLPSSCEVVAYCHMGNTKLCIQRKGYQPHFIATMEHAAIPSSVRVSIGASLIYRLVLPPATTVYVALCTCLLYTSPSPRD